MIITCVVLAVSAAYAEDSRKNEIGFLLGATVAPTLNVAGTGGTRLEIGTGATFQLTYARRLVTAPHLALYFEVPALATPLQDITASIGAVPRNYDSFFVAPGLRVKLAPTARVSPWFSAGGGYALFDESASRVDGTHNTTRGTNGGAVQFGGGRRFSNANQVVVSDWPKSGISIQQNQITMSTPAVDFSTTLHCPGASFCIFEASFLPSND